MYGAITVILFFILLSPLHFIVEIFIASGYEINIKFEKKNTTNKTTLSYALFLHKKKTKKTVSTYCITSYTIVIALAEQSFKVHIN